MKVVPSLVVLLVVVTSLVLGQVSAGLPTLNCKFQNTANVSLIIVNDCGASAKVRTCSDKFEQCVGYMNQPNHFQDCPQRIAVGASVELVLDTNRGYIVIDCPNWWGPGIDNWWTVEPSGSPSHWPKSFTIPKPKSG